MPEAASQPRQNSAPYDWQRERDTVAEIKATHDVPAEKFPGHKGIFLANLEGWLGMRFVALLAERDALVERLAFDETDAPEGIEDHIGHSVELTGGEDAPLGVICVSCGEYLVEWPDR